MTWFSLPPLRPGTADPVLPFVDLDGCNAWLALQPLANAPLMQSEIGKVLESLNTWPIPPRSRFKILDVLRKAIFAVEAESAKRFEHRPLPLTTVEQRAFDASCHLWRQLATGYLHCLRACLDGDAGIAEHGAKVVHRVLSTLRCEQIARYRASSVVPGHWWRLLHAALASAEQLEAMHSPIADRLFAETRESTPAGQYAMAILLHLARPYELSRGQMTATLRWLARWRELAAPHADAEAARYARHILIDLSSDVPVHSAAGTPALARWVPLDGVLGKFKSRLKGLKEGQSPEDLKLGAGITAEACIGLLQYLHSALQTTPADLPAERIGRSIGVTATVEATYRLLGGKAPSAPGEPTSTSNRRVAEQIAIFGRASREEEKDTFAPEAWRLLQATAADLLLLRPAGLDGERIGLRALIGVRLDSRHAPVIAVSRSIVTAENGDIVVSARIQAANGESVLATGREKGTQKATAQPAVFVPANPAIEKPASLFIAAGVMAKLIRLDADIPGGLKIGSPIDRGSNYERLGCS